MSSYQPSIHVIGAGVIGLSTAVWLLARGYKNVVLIATDFPGDPPTIEYTSPWAGARWQSSAAKDNLTGQRKSLSERKEKSNLIYFHFVL